MIWHPYILQDFKFSGKYFWSVCSHLKMAAFSTLRLANVSQKLLQMPLLRSCGSALVNPSKSLGMLLSIYVLCDL